MSSYLRHFRVPRTQFCEPQINIILQTYFLVTYEGMKMDILNEIYVCETIDKYHYQGPSIKDWTSNPSILVQMLELLYPPLQLTFPISSSYRNIIL